MDDEQIFPMDEWEMLSPAERQWHRDERIVTDLSQVDPEFLADIRANAKVRYEEHQARNA